MLSSLKVLDQVCKTVHCVFGEVWSLRFVWVFCFFVFSCGLLVFVFVVIVEFVAFCFCEGCHCLRKPDIKPRFVTFRLCNASETFLLK